VIGSLHPLAANSIPGFNGSLCAMLAARSKHAWKTLFSP